MSNLPIGVFDSGIGGLFVLNKCAFLMPNERFIYLADSANMPYGIRSTDEIRRAAFCCADTLFAMNCKALLVACNTATENAIDGIRALYSTRIIVGLEPAIKPALRELKRGYAVALVTPATFASSKFNGILSCAESSRIVAVPCDTLASVIERGNDAEIERETERLLFPYRDAQAVILGCSHYSYITRIIKKRFGGMKIYDGADGAALQLLSRLKLSGLCAPQDAIGKVDFYSTKKRECR